MSTAPIPEVVYYPELGKVWVVTRDPFVEPAAGEDPGIVASFDYTPGAEFDAASAGAYRSAAMLLWNVMNRDWVGGSFAGPRGR